MLGTLSNFLYTPVRELKSANQLIRSHFFSGIFSAIFPNTMADHCGHMWTPNLSVDENMVT